jgi:hypothetical protein
LSDWGGIEIEKDLNGLAKLSGVWQTIRELLAPGELLNNFCSSARPWFASFLDDTTTIIGQDFWPHTKVYKIEHPRGLAPSNIAAS